ncbi:MULTISPECIES: pilus assembly protein PilP [unclassified Janthinobacterium]|uniref:pilus assembly protein PilP n=1 Tax=unclassified Janthinobacterium TaxID=2610881 RepID=UPI00161D6D7D|nr:MULTISPECIES: pilus assembly protein PilP [unclassified Janthinobacterium]MBB5370812.1 type IV pilus assembly protein PilO [Janthinobacterium sp. K2C7]MBB5383618.1 type IV pilus assembly protein PilO [Janthinobacterium sp. K2Li3]MBB5389072.1 type IV pilus assembly protein PilO [Janthinobacterium sp. K2E3]
MLSLKVAASWPLSSRLVCAGLLGALMAVVVYVAWLGRLAETLQAAQAEEARLRVAHQLAQVKAGRLPALRAGQRQAAATLARLEQQLPRQQEMADLLSSINQAGLARGLHFALFKPGPAIPATLPSHYVALPIAVQLRGGYHAIGAFTADLARLPRIVTVHELALVAGNDGVLTLDAVLHAYRLPDATELAAQAKLLPVKTQSMPVPHVVAPALDYDAADLPDPFGAAVQAVAATQNAVAAPDLKRPREALESVALSEMTMVGSVRHEGRLSALLQAGGRVHVVVVGQHLGHDHGLVTEISEQGLRYREVLQEANGAWRERRGGIEVQAGKVIKPIIAEAQP